MVLAVSFWITTHSLFRARIWVVLSSSVWISQLVTKWIHTVLAVSFQTTIPLFDRIWVLTVSFQTPHLLFSERICVVLATTCWISHPVTKYILTVLVVSFQTTHPLFDKICVVLATSYWTSHPVSKRIRMVLVVFFQTRHSLFNDTDLYGLSHSRIISDRAFRL